VGGNKIAFGAEGKRGFEPSPCADRDSLKCDKSEIYVLEFDPSNATIPNKPTALAPRLAVAGYSISPILSGDGKRVAFLKTNRKGNPWRYNIAVANIDGVVDGGFSVEGSAFSSGAFVGDTLLDIMERRFIVAKGLRNSATIHRHDSMLVVPRMSSGQPLGVRAQFPKLLTRIPRI
jgi:hypothetical protein